MIRVIVRRLAMLLPTLLVVSFAVFSLQQLLPGDPAVTLAGGTSASAEVVEQIRAEYHFDDPFFVQYGRWLRGAVQLDFGESVASGRSVAHEIFSRLPMTFSLAGAGLFFGLLIGGTTGLISALRPKTTVDRAAVGFTTVGISVPSFFLGMVLVIIFAVHWHVFPPSGYRPFSKYGYLEWAKRLILPGLALGLALAATIARQLRAALLDVLDANYIRTAWAKGGGPLLVLRKHALRNAALPVITVLALQTSVLLGGSVIIEQIFSIPGLGTYVISSISLPDLPVVQGATLLFVLIYVGVMLLVDLVYMAVDPRVRAG